MIDVADGHGDFKKSLEGRPAEIRAPRHAQAVLMVQKPPVKPAQPPVAGLAAVAAKARRLAAEDVLKRIGHHAPLLPWMAGGRPAGRRAYFVV
jgi:hypothetical protein